MCYKILLEEKKYNSFTVYKVITQISRNTILVQEILAQTQRQHNNEEKRPTENTSIYCPKGEEREKRQNGKTSFKFIARSFSCRLQKKYLPRNLNVYRISYKFINQYFRST